MGGPAGVDYSDMVSGTEPGLSIRPTKVKRIWLASFLSAMAAVVVVALAGVVVLFSVAAIGSLFGLENFDGFGPAAVDAPILSGIFISGLAAVLNWYFFFIVIPVTMLVLRFSIGQFPRRRIVRPLSYFRWAGLWGALLVVAPCLFGIAVTGSWDETSGQTVLRFLSGGVTGLFIGGVSGVAVGGLWLAIVRPARQIKDIDTSVFT